MSASLRWVVGSGRRVLQTEARSASESTSSDEEMYAEPDDQSASDAPSHDVELEDWVSWLVRTTGVAMEYLRTTGVDD